MRTLRNLESLMVQIAEQTTDDAEQTLKSGGIAVAILMDERESLKDEVAALFEELKEGTLPLVRRIAALGETGRDACMHGDFPELSRRRVRG